MKKIGYFAKHEKSANHIAVMKAVEQEKAGAAMTRFVSVEPADALLVRTISSLAWSILNKLPSAIFGELMSIQHQNGAVVSLNHTSNESFLILLRCGGIVVRQMQLENLVPPFMRRIFRHGVPFSFIGDGSQDSSHTEVEATGICMIGKGGKPAMHPGDLAELDLAESNDGKSPACMMHRVCGHRINEQCAGLLYLLMPCAHCSLDSPTSTLKVRRHAQTLL